MKEKELYYKSLADVFITEYQDNLKLSEKVLTAKGVITSMYSELLSYRIKNGYTSKFKQQDERLQILEDIFDTFSAIDSRNFEYRLVIREKNKEILHLESEINKLRTEIENHLKTID